MPRALKIARYLSVSMERYRDDFHVVTDDGKLVRVVRSATPFPSDEVHDRSLRALGDVIPPADRASRSLLFDSRNAPPRNDDAFEAALRRHRARLFVGYRRFAILVRTAVGKLQTQRFARELQADVHTFQDEAAALAYLSAPPS